MTSSLTPPSFDKRLVSMALLVVLGVVVQHRVEALLPLPAPWIKLGLANVMTLLALVFLGFREALIVTGMRIFLGSIIGGTFLGPTSLSDKLLSCFRVTGRAKDAKCLCNGYAGQTRI